VQSPPKRAGLTDEENRALDLYTSGTVARAINASLRKGGTHHGKIPTHTIPGVPKDLDLDHYQRDLDAAIAASEIAHDATLWRGVLLRKADVDRLVPGAVINEHGYQSTSTEEFQAKRVVAYWRRKGLYKGTKPAYYKILARKGQHGAVGLEDVKEVLLPRDQQFRVVRVDKNSDGDPVFVVEAVDSTTGVGMVRGSDLLDTFDYDNEVKGTDSSYSGMRIIANKSVRGRISELQGFGGLPGVRSKEDMDAEIRRGAIPLFRGVKAHVVYDQATGKYKTLKTSREITDEFKTGPMFYESSGATAYGAGIYVSSNESTAKSYAGSSWGTDDRQKGATMRMALRRGARIIGHRDLKVLQRKLLPKVLREMDDAQQKELAAAGNDWKKMQEINARYVEKRKKYGARLGAIADEGIFATLLGYDAIRTGESRGTRSDIWVILNRTALLVQDKDV